MCRSMLDVEGSLSPEENLANRKTEINLTELDVLDVLDVHDNTCIQLL